MSETSTEPGPRNPYYHLMMIRDPRAFYGRYEALHRLYSAVRDQQCLSIVGARRIGKSSLLNAVRSPAVQQRSGYNLSAYVMAYIDTGEQPQKNYEDFLALICEHLVGQNRERLASLEVPQSCDAGTFRHFLNSIHELGFHPVLLLDEFEKIAGEENLEADFFYFLRAQANLGNISYITASKDTLDKVCHADLVGSPFFNIFSTLRLGAFTPEEARDLICTPALHAGVAFRPQEVEWIRDIAGRHPFFIQRACYALFEALRQADAAALDLLQLERQIYSQLQQHFQYSWLHMDKEIQERLSWEARRSGVTQRHIPELSESRLFREFVCDICNINFANIPLDHLDKVLNNVDDIQFLGESLLSHLNMVYTQSKSITPSAAERGLIVQRCLFSAIEDLRPGPHHKQDDVRWRSYQILSLRHKDHLRNEEIAARLSIGMRHFFRERNRAIKDLHAILLKKEDLSKEHSRIRDEDNSSN